MNLPIKHDPISPIQAIKDTGVQFKKIYFYNENYGLRPNTSFKQ